MGVNEQARGEGQTVYKVQLEGEYNCNYDIILNYYTSTMNFDFRFYSDSSEPALAS